MPPIDAITRTVADLFAQESRPPLDQTLPPPTTAETGLQPYVTAYSCRSLPQGILSYVYPLVDVVVSGPVEDKSPSSVGGPAHWSVNVSRSDGQSMRVLKRETQEEQLAEHHKSTLTLIFPRKETAAAWRKAIEAAAVKAPTDTLRRSAVSNADSRRKENSVRGMVERAAGSGGSGSGTGAGTGGTGTGASEQGAGGWSGSGGGVGDEPPEHSILGMLAVPTSGYPQHSSETLKIEIAKTLSSR